MAKAFKKGKAYMKGELMKKHGSFEDDSQDGPPGKLSFFNHSEEVSLRSRSNSTCVPSVP